jgi:hypothetical protein
MWLFILAIVGAFIFGIVSCAQWSNRSQAEDQRKLEAKISYIHENGFGAVGEQNLGTDKYGRTYFYYNVGSCELQIFTSSPQNNYQTYIERRAGSTGTISVTYKSLGKLDENRDCFR